MVIFIVRVRHNFTATLVFVQRLCVAKSLLHKRTNEVVNRLSVLLARFVKHVISAVANIFVCFYFATFHYKPLRASRICGFCDFVDSAQLVEIAASIRLVRDEQQGNGQRGWEIGLRACRTCNRTRNHIALLFFLHVANEVSKTCTTIALPQYPNRQTRFFFVVVDYALNSDHVLLGRTTRQISTIRGEHS